MAEKITMGRDGKLNVPNNPTLPFIEGDTFFPVIDEREWQLVSNEDFPADEKHVYAYSFQVWTKSNHTQ